MNARAQTGKTLVSRNPATGEVVDTFETFDADELERALDAAAGAVSALREMGPDGRARALERAADILEAEASQFGGLMTAEMGKPVGQAAAEAKKCAWVCRHYAETGPQALADRPLDAPEKGEASLRALPLGPVLAVMPWNYPFWQVFRFAAPNLMLGNPGLLKHASAVPRCAVAIESVLKRAGFPDGAFRALLVGSDTAEGLIADDRVRGVTLTGSERAGAKVAAAAGRAMKKCVLELGGSDAYVVMPSADVEAAVETAVTARVQNNGQSCIAAKRFIIHADVYERFRDAFTAKMGALTVGDPSDSETDIGPLVSEEAAAELDEQVSETLSAGALAVLRPNRRNAFMTPGVLEAVPPDSRGYREELFGPVAMLFRADTLDDAIRLANDSPYGLGSAFWSGDAAEIEEACDRLEAGSTYVNQMVASDPRLPFGGVKRSGHGRELAEPGLFEFANLKTLAIQR